VDSRHLVDPDLLPALDATPTTALTLELLPTARARGPALPADPAVMACLDYALLRVSGPQGAPAVAIAVAAPKRRRAVMPCILHVHGSGCVAGSAAAL
jgi:hypothetical protein